ncbi:hypothetical protein [Variovorax paradoxus]|jgi:hypothetical protein|uniref:hypothetical protein n=1 Tax=Variovorax paradoxus TaxID=34073 RepID=UPI00285BBF6F|nr:hypothetical protein [Variovorax sp. 3319]
MGSMAQDARHEATLTKRQEEFDECEREVVRLASALEAATAKRDQAKQQLDAQIELDMRRD